MISGIAQIFTKDDTLVKKHVFPSSSLVYNKFRSKTISIKPNRLQKNIDVFIQLYFFKKKLKPFIDLSLPRRPLAQKWFVDRHSLSLWLRPELRPMFSSSRLSPDARLSAGWEPVWVSIHVLVWTFGWNYSIDCLNRCSVQSITSWTTALLGPHRLVAWIRPSPLAWVEPALQDPSRWTWWAWGLSSALVLSGLWFRNLDLSSFLLYQRVSVEGTDFGRYGEWSHLKV